MSLLKKNWKFLYVEEEPYKIICCLVKSGQERRVYKYQLLGVGGGPVPSTQLSLRTPIICSLLCVLAYVNLLSRPV